MPTPPTLGKYNTGDTVRFFDPSSEELPAALPPRRRELFVETLKFLTALVALAGALVALHGKYPSLSPWIFDSIVGTGLLIATWVVTPRVAAWARRIQKRARIRRFIATNDVRLRELLAQFAIFTSSSDSRSLMCILRSACSQNQQAIEQIVAGDYIGSWLDCFRQQLGSPAGSLASFLQQCREFSSIVQAFNTNYVLRAQRQLALVPALPEYNLEQLDQFREEYNAFLRDIEPWAKSIGNYLESAAGIADQPILWRTAPTSYFERVPSFRKTKPTGT